MASSPPPSSPPSSALPAKYFPCRMTTKTCQPTLSRACLRRQHACLHETVFWKILHVFRPLCPIACVFTVVWLYIPDISFFAIHMRPSCDVLNALRRLRPLTGVFTAVWLHIPDISSVPDRVCVHRRMVTHSGHFLLRYSHQTFLQRSQRASSSPPTHGCVFVCISPPAWLHLPDISLFTLATHSFSHICTLSNTHFCSCFHCHYYEVPFPNIRK